MTTSPAPLIVSFGEMLIDFVPDVAGVSLAESGGFIKAPGGAPANVACAITKLGGKSAFIGKVNLLLLAGLCTMQGTYFSPFVL
jgi:fructokinase